MDFCFKKIIHVGCGVNVQSLGVFLSNSFLPTIFVGIVAVPTFCRNSGSLMNTEVYLMLVVLFLACFFFSQKSFASAILSHALFDNLQSYACVVTLAKASVL